MKRWMGLVEFRMSFVGSSWVEEKGRSEGRDLLLPSLFSGDKLRFLVCG